MTKCPVCKSTDIEHLSTALSEHSGGDWKQIYVCYECGATWETIMTSVLELPHPSGKPRYRDITVRTIITKAEKVNDETTYKN